MIVFWAGMIVCTLGAVAMFAVGMAAHVRDQQIPREVTAAEAARIMRENV